MKENKRRKKTVPNLPELLAPAGNYEKLVTAIHYGADGVYLGGRRFSLRAKAGNFSDEMIRAGVVYGHEHGVKIYVTVNIFAHNNDFNGLEEYLLLLWKTGVDGIIVADPGIFAVARRVVPSLPIHLSTQANVTNHVSASFWFDRGAVRLNLARELSLHEIETIRREVEGELEIFVHGAICISYSGRCMLSNYMTGRDANRGNCAHPCRYSYSLVEEKRPGELFPVEEDDRGTYIFNAKDLCLLERLPQLVSTGVDSLKIEGRMKSIFYVGGTVRIYRAALDYLAALPAEAWDRPDKIVFPDEFMVEITRIGTRGTSGNFIFGKPGADEMIYSSSRAEQSYEPVAVIRRTGKMPLVEMRNTVFPGEEVEYMFPSMELMRVRIVELIGEDGVKREKANPGNRLVLRTEPDLEVGLINGMLRRKRK
ncbi:U32 family peptidase C-terminal domain-containing protein [Desulfomarina sp.]